MKSWIGGSFPASKTSMPKFPTSFAETGERMEAVFWDFGETGGLIGRVASSIPYNGIQRKIRKNAPADRNRYTTKPVIDGLCVGWNTKDYSAAGISAVVPVAVPVAVSVAGIGATGTASVGVTTGTTSTAPVSEETGELIGAKIGEWVSGREEGFDPNPQDASVPTSESARAAEMYLFIEKSKKNKDLSHQHMESSKKFKQKTVSETPKASVRSFFSTGFRDPSGFGAGFSCRRRGSVLRKAYGSRRCFRREKEAFGGSSGRIPEAPRADFSSLISTGRRG